MKSDLLSLPASGGTLALDRLVRHLFLFGKSMSFLAILSCEDITLQQFKMPIQPVLPDIH